MEAEAGAGVVACKCERSEAVEEAEGLEDAGAEAEEEETVEAVVAWAGEGGREEAFRAEAEARV